MKLYQLDSSYKVGSKSIFTTEFKGVGHAQLVMNLILFGKVT